MGHSSTFPQCCSVSLIYGVSGMREWLLFIPIISGFRQVRTPGQKHLHDQSQMQCNLENVLFIEEVSI